VSLDGVVFVFGAFVSFLVAAGIFLSFYAPAYREEARRDMASAKIGPGEAGEREAR
jgi:hypothetical protein